MRHPSIVRLATVTAVAVGLAVVAAGPAAAGAKEMTRAQAARQYTASVCPYNAVQAEYRAVLARAQEAGSPLTVGSPVPAGVQEAARRVATATATSGRGLRNPPAAWPEAVRPNIEIAIAYNGQLLGYYRAIAEATTVPDSTPLMKAMTEVQKLNLPILRAALGVDASDPCAGVTPGTTAGRQASGTPAPTLPVADWPTTGAGPAVVPGG